MPIPINKVQDIESNAQIFDSQDISTMLPFMQQNQPLFFLLEPQAGKREKEAMKEMWLKSTDLGEDRVKLAESMSQQNISILQSKGLIRGEGDVYELTQSGKRVLKESILSEESSFCKQASKQMVSKNSYDFGKEILVKVSHPEKFGTRFITVSKKAFANKNIKPIEFDSYDVQTRTASGDMKSLADYTDEDLIKVLHLSKKIIDNSSKIALASTATVPVHKIKAFAEMVMEEINSR